MKMKDFNIYGDSKREQEQGRRYEEEYSQVCCTSMEEDGSCREHLGMRFGRKVEVDKCEHGYVSGCRACNPDE